MVLPCQVADCAIVYRKNAIGFISECKVLTWTIVPGAGPVGMIKFYVFAIPCPNIAAEEIKYLLSAAGIFKIFVWAVYPFLLVLCFVKFNHAVVLYPYKVIVQIKYLCSRCVFAF